MKTASSAVAWCSSLVLLSLLLLGCRGTCCQTSTPSVPLHTQTKTQYSRGLLDYLEGVGGNFDDIRPLEDLQRTYDERSRR